ncbi:hypothetical protein K4F52_009426 [Lecanicillium sp. MT-2017a]|nr:hypothetical protein K4F52_009426 [Lecanicillium sp. MT-2017a]
MSDADSTSPSGKALPWTDEAKYQLLLRIVGQLIRNNQSIDWKEINIPGRTVKSLQHQWAQIRAAIEKDQGAVKPATKAATKKASAQSGDKKRGADELATPESTPQKPKRQRKVLPKSPKAPTLAEDSPDELAGEDFQDVPKA